jgi:SGNH hydrolase-like domain, acetyltransferase AlgX
LCLSKTDHMRRMREAITSIAPEIGHVDLIPNLVDAVKRGQLPYYPDDAHWSPEGHKIAADTINEYLSAQKQIQPN